MTPAETWRTQRFDRFERAVEPALLALSVLLIPVLLIPAVSTTKHGEQIVFDWFDYIVWGVFVADYLIRFSLAQDRWSFVRHNPLDLALVALPVLRPLRLARVARVARVGRLAALTGRSSRRVRRSLHARVVAYLLVIAGGLTLVCSVAILACERHAKGANIHGYGDALWWAATTVSTVGYGDHFPVTLGGRLVAVTLIVAGVMLFGVITAALAAWFIRHVEEDPAPAGAELAGRLIRLEEAVTRMEAALSRLGDPRR